MMLADNIPQERYDQLYLESKPWHTNTSDINTESILKLVERVLPKNYNFEVLKTVNRLKELKVKHCVLQFPEGLLIWSDVISWILQSCIPYLQVTILGDVTYGACCIEDIIASNIGGDFLIHYGHSCLIPITQTVKIPMLYVFVDIHISEKHLKDTLLANFNPKSNEWGNRIALMGVVQYTSLIYQLKEDVRKLYLGKDSEIKH